MKKITGIFFVCSLLAAGIFSINASSNLGFNLSGAPGEGSCASCHIGNLNPDNIGSIQITINGNSNHATFIPDSIYDIEVSSNHSGINKFGFALNARYQGIEFENAGTFLYDTDSTLSISDYVTHTNNSNTGNSFKTWKFKWKAPANPTKQTITFYAAGVMANNDTNVQGDKVYLDSISLQSGITGINKNTVSPDIRLLKSESNWILESTNSVKSIRIISLNGTEIFSTLNQLSNNTYSIQTNLNEIGIYILWVQTEKGIWTSKIINR